MKPVILGTHASAWSSTDDARLSVAALCAMAGAEALFDRLAGATAIPHGLKLVPAETAFDALAGTRGRHDPRPGQDRRFFGRCEAPSALPR